MTNFNSAHDTEFNMSLDKFFYEDGSENSEVIHNTYIYIYLVYLFNMSLDKFFYEDGSENSEVIHNIYIFILFVQHVIRQVFLRGWIRKQRGNS